MTTLKCISTAITTGHQHSPKSITSITAPLLSPARCPSTVTECSWSQSGLYNNLIMTDMTNFQVNNRPSKYTSRTFITKAKAAASFTEPRRNSILGKELVLTLNHEIPTSFVQGLPHTDAFFMLRVAFRHDASRCDLYMVFCGIFCILHQH